MIHFKSLPISNGFVNLPICCVFLVITLLSTGCANFYQTNTVMKFDTARFEAVKDPAKIAILHTSENVYAANNLALNGDFIEADLSNLPENNLKYLYPKPGKRNIYQKQDASNVLRQVHLYTTIKAPVSHVSIPISAITRTDVYTKNKGATARSHIVGTGLGLITIMLVAAAIGSTALPWL